MAGEIEQSASSNEFDAHWESKHTSHGCTVENDTEATALSVRALARINPQSALLAKAARWLVGNRRNGYYWESTRQTAFAIFGLIDYVKVSKELSPDYNVAVYIGGEQVLTRHVGSEDLASAQAFVIERKGPQLAGANQVRVVKTGRGALYLSTTLSYFTRDEDIQAQASPNLTLTREYLRLRVVESGEQARWEIEPLTGELRSGDLIVSRLRVKGARAQYMMIEDPIPAGCEQVDRISGLDLAYIADAGSHRWTDWYSAREFRDQKTALFVDYFDGDAMFQVALRVQVPGDFRVAPARAELMYQPTVQSNTASGKMSFLDKGGPPGGAEKTPRLIAVLAIYLFGKFDKSAPVAAVREAPEIRASATGHAKTAADSLAASRDDDRQVPAVLLGAAARSYSPVD